MDVRLLNLVQFVACCASFTWAVLSYFRRPPGGALPTRMRVVAATGTATMVAHAAGFLLLDGPVVSTALVVGLVCYLGSLALFWWALLTTWDRKFDIAFSERRPQHVMTQGPYRVVRHPLYAAYSLAWVAGALSVGQWWAWAGVVVMLWQYIDAITREERQFLSSELKEEYLAYRRVVGMLLPIPWASLAGRPEASQAKAATGEEGKAA